MKSLKEIFLLICLAFLVRLPWLLMVPQIEAPDENTHLWVAEFISRFLRLPDYQSVLAAGPQAVYGSLPQFGYLPHIFFLKCLGWLTIPGHAFYFARLGSLCMGLIVVVVSYFIGRLLFLPNHVAALALPLIIVFHPQFVFVTSYVNNDATTAALSALILAFLILGIKRGLDLWLVFSFSICFSLLILAKYSGYCTLLISGLFLSLIIYLHRTKIKKQVVLFTYIALITTVLTVWWFVRNYYEFGGDITGVKTMNHIWQMTYHKKLIAFDSAWAILNNHAFWRMLFFSFWGWFGYMTRSLPRVFYYGYLGFVIISAGQFIRAIWTKSQKKVSWLGELKSLCVANINLDNVQTPIGGSGIVWIRSWTWLLLLSCFVFNFLTCMYGCYSGVAGPQGRYLFPSEIAIMAILIGGLASRHNRRSEVLILALVVFNFVAYCYSSFFLFQLYRTI